MSKQANFFAIGLFVVIAFIIAVGTFIAFGSAKLHRNTALLVATFRESTNGLREGANVKAFGVEVGLVRDIKLHRVEDTDEVVIPVIMEIDIDEVSSLLGGPTRPDFDDAACLEALERDALATLQLESFVTGLLYVEMVFDVEQQGFVLDSPRFSEYRAIPTIPTELQMMFQSLQRIAANLAGTDFDGLVEDTRLAVTDIQEKVNSLDFESMQASLETLIEDTRTLLNSPEVEKVVTQLSEVLEALNGISKTITTHADGTLVQLRRTLDELEAASGKAGRWMDTSGPAYRGFVEALDEIREAARSLRILVDYLERNPNALITGKPAESSP